MEVGELGAEGLEILKSKGKNLDRSGDCNQPVELPEIRACVKVSFAAFACLLAHQFQSLAESTRFGFQAPGWRPGPAAG
jgi:hypothetical protein